MSIHILIYTHAHCEMYRVAKKHRVRYNIGHFLQMSLQLLVRLAGNNLYHNESYESLPPCSFGSTQSINQSLLSTLKQRQQVGDSKGEPKILRYVYNWHICAP